MNNLDVIRVYHCETCGKYELCFHRDTLYCSNCSKPMERRIYVQSQKDNELVEEVLEILRFKALCRIRGLSIDIENQQNKDYYGGSKNEYQELYRHLENLKYIIADIDCALKYLDRDEKERFKFLKRKLGFKEVEDD